MTLSFLNLRGFRMKTLQLHTVIAAIVWVGVQHLAAIEAHGVEVSAEATPAEKAAARALFQKHGGGRFFGYSGHDAKVLHLLDPALTNDDIVPLGHLVSLQEVYLAGLAIDDDGLAPLAGLNKLRSLTLSGTRPNSPELTMHVTGKGFAWLAMLPDLEKIWLRSLPLEPEHLSQLARVQGLKDLWISGSRVVEGDALQTKDETADALLASLKDVKGLESFRFTAHQKHAMPTAFSDWKSAESLKFVALEGVTLDRHAWSGFRRFQALQSLQYRAPVDEVDWAVLAALPNLRKLHLDGLSDEALEGIHQCKQVRSLHLGHGITDAGVVHLTKMQHLKSLTLWTSQVDGSGFADAEKMAGLKSLVLFNTQLNDEGVKHVARLPALESISFEDTRVTPEGMKALLAAKATLKRVTPTETLYEGGLELSNPYYVVAEEMRKTAPLMQFNFTLDAPP